MRNLVALGAAVLLVGRTILLGNVTTLSLGLFAHATGRREAL